MNHSPIPTTYAPPVSGTPQHTPQVPTEPQPSLEQGSNAQHLAVRNHMDQCLRSYETQQGSILFVDRTTSRAFPPESQVLLDHLKSVSSYQFSVCLSDKAINNAIAAKRGRGDALPLNHALYTRVVDADNHVTLKQSNNRLVTISPHSFQLCAFPVVEPNTLPNYFLPTWRPPRPHIEPTHLNPIEHSMQHPPNVDQIFEATNLPYDQRILILAWLVLCLMPNRRLPLLQVIGDPQSGKTDSCKAMLSLIDPQEWMIRSPSRKKDIEPDLLSSYILAMDAVEELRNDAQNLLVDCLDICTYRRKSRPYVSFYITNPVLLNTVESVVTDSELSKRTISIDLPSLHENGHAPGFIDQTFPERMPGAFTGLLELTSKVLGALQDPRPLERSVSAEQRDYCQIGVIVADILEGDRSLFWKQYEHNQAIQQQKKIDDHAVSRAIQYFGRFYNDGTTDSVNSWLQLLKPYCADNQHWPRSARDMAARLKEAAYLLRPLGYEIFRDGKIASYGYWTIKPPKSKE